MSELFVRLDVTWLDHPDLILLGPEARGVHVIALALAKRMETDGWVDVVHIYREGGTEKVVEDLLRAGLLEVDDAGDKVRPSGWLDRNPSQGAIDATRKAKRRGGSIGNHRRWKHPGAFGDCSICHPALADSGADAQVVAPCDRTPIAGVRTPIALRSPETETETETDNPPPDSQSDPPPEQPGPVAAVVDDQQIRRTAVLVGQALAAGATDPGAYAATVTKRILLGDDPGDRDEIHQALTDGQTPEAIASWRALAQAAGADPLTPVTGPRTSRRPTEAERAEIRARAAERIADDQARLAALTSAGRAAPDTVAEIIGATRAKRRGTTP